MHGMVIRSVHIENNCRSRRKLLICLPKPNVLRKNEKISNPPRTGTELAADAGMSPPPEPSTASGSSACEAAVVPAVTGGVGGEVASVVGNVDSLVAALDVRVPVVPETREKFHEMKECLLYMYVYEEGTSATQYAELNDNLLKLDWVFKLDFHIPSKGKFFTEYITLLKLSSIEGPLKKGLKWKRKLIS